MLDKISGFVGGYIKKLQVKRWSILLVVLSYLFFTAYYMGPSVWHCNDTLYGFGDNTAGPVWRFSLDNPQQSPLGSFTSATNYPVGENLYTPVNYSLSGQSVLIWGISRITNPICGYNLVNMLGFMASALVMFGFIYSLFRNKWVAWIAGYAVAFAPYFQMKVGGHIGYGYQALLIGVIWAFFNLLIKQRKRDAVYLGTLIAACFYFDPYFSLLAGTILAPLLFTWGAISLWRIRKRYITKDIVVNQLRMLAGSFGVFVLLMLPLVGVMLSHGSEINKSVAAYRGNVLFEARACSNLPHEYAVPFVLHPLGKLVSEAEYKKLIDGLHSGFTCGIGEDTVGISIAVLTVVGIGTIIFAWERLNRRKINFVTHYDKRLVFLGMGAVGLFAAIMALPPLDIAGIPSPSYALLEITTTWRTLTRLYVDVNIAAIVLFCVFLVYFARHFKKHHKILAIGFAVIFLIIFVEYQAFRPFSGNSLSTFSYKKDVPTAYQWLRDQKDIQEIAEYPLERSGGESNAMAYYLSMQLAHGKTLFNGNIPTSYEEQLKNSLKDISDPQTLDVLYSIGVDAVVIHGVEESEVRKIPGLEILHAAPQSPFNILAFTPLVRNDTMVIARITDRQPVKKMLSLDSGFVRNHLIIRSAADWEYETLNKSVLKVTGIPGTEAGPANTPTTQCFSVRIAGEKESADLTIYADGKAVQQKALGPEYQRIRVEAAGKIELVNSKGNNMRVEDIGCYGSEK